MSSEIDDIFKIGPRGDDAPLDRERCGGKAAELWRMVKLGLEVPPAFVLPTDLCTPVNSGNERARRALERGLAEGIAYLEQIAGRRFGDARHPLLVSVRSGAAQSMPGMLDTVLNVGLNGEAVRGLIRDTGNPRLAWDSFRRFLQGYAEVVLAVPAALFEARLAEMMRGEGVASEAELDPEALERLSLAYRDIVTDAAGEPVPEPPMQQLQAVARAVYRSWLSGKAGEYRRLNALGGLRGTAVTVQTMVFGNSGGRSGAGVAFTRNPATGKGGLYVDFLSDAQGEDVVSGRRRTGGFTLLAARLPEAARALASGAERLEREFRDMQDIEFTVEDGRLYFLQTRRAKRTPRAALQVAVDLVRDGVIDRTEALRRLDAVDVAAATTARFVGEAAPAASCVPASIGVAVGRVAFDTERATTLAAAGDPVILVRRDTTTDDIVGFGAAAGILTAVGGRTCHAAVVARQLGKVCVVGCAALQVDAGARRAVLAGKAIEEGDWLSLDGETGAVYFGKREVVLDRPEAELAEVQRWRDGVRLPAAS